MTKRWCKARVGYTGLHCSPCGEASPCYVSHILGWGLQLLTGTKPWLAPRIPFPLSFPILPERMSRGTLNRILLTTGEPPLYHIQDVEAQIYRDAKECLNLLWNRLGTSQFFFEDMPSTLDTYVFGFLTPLYKVWLPNIQLQEHLKQLSNLFHFCDDILNSYIRLSLRDRLQFSPRLSASSSETTNTQIESSRRE
jgi:metaxin